MLALGALFTLVLASIASQAQATTFSVNVNTNASSTCQIIHKALSSVSGIYYPNTNSSNYAIGVEHWANSSSQVAACVVEPGTPSEVAKIVSISLDLICHYGNGRRRIDVIRS
jgi:hypothetical protein